MNDPELDTAINIILRKIADDPSNLNKLSHDILRKIISYVGDLSERRAITVNGIDYPLDKLQAALTAATAYRPHGRWLAPGMRLLVCNYCKRVQCAVYGENQQLHQCMCKDCPNMICGRYEDCLGAGNQTCARCVSYTGATRKCDACSKYI